MSHDWIAILDFGSQYTQLIARRIREQHVYCEILRFDTPAAKLAERNPRGVILSGGPSSVYDESGPRPDPDIFKMDVPLLGICYGMQLMAQELGGHVARGNHREFGYAEIDAVDPVPLFEGLEKRLQVWMSHGDQVDKLPGGFRITARTDSCPVAAMADRDNRRIGLQFHPEVVHTPNGRDMLKHFAFDICGCRGDWKMSSFIEEQIKLVRETVGEDHVLCGLSGGVDSSVVAALLHKAIGNQLHCVFVDNGVCRFGEVEQVKTLFGDALGIDLRISRSGALFISNLKGVIDPEKKRKIIGKTFIDVFSEEARRLGDIKYLAQGTLYPDVIESVSPIGGPSATIKSHHNVGGLPEDLSFKLIEPLRELFKDEVRELGRELGLPDHVVDRQPFPGPGLAVRILGEVNSDRISILQQADLRVQEEVEKLGEYRDIWQSFAVLLPVQSVGVMGDDRTYENVIAVRAVRSIDGMTAQWYKLPYETLDRISTRIINEVRGVNRVVYDISSKPPATIEWE